MWKKKLCPFISSALVSRSQCVRLIFGSCFEEKILFANDSDANLDYFWMSFGIYCFRLGKRLLSIFHDNSVTFWIKNLKLQHFLSAINTERGYYFCHLHDTIIICEAIYGSWFENFLLFFFFREFPRRFSFCHIFSACVIVLFFTYSVWCDYWYY